MEKKNIIKKKEQLTDEQKTNVRKNINDILSKNLPNINLKYHPPYMGPDGYLHCACCKRRYEPGHKCERPCL